MNKVLYNRFCEVSNRKHNNKYDYTKTVIDTIDDIVTVCCKEHGDFTVLAKTHMRGGGSCPRCSTMKKNGAKHRLTNAEFIARAKAVHGDKYDYSKVEYIKTDSPVIIICKEHNFEFKQRPDNHLYGKGCPLCGRKKCGFGKKPTLTQETFIEKLKEIYGDTYDFSEVKYTKHSEKVKVICPIHGAFMKEAGKLLVHSACPQCAKYNHITPENFQEKARNRFGDKFDYSKVSFKQTDDKIIIGCPIHGEIETTPYGHLKSSFGCPHCAKDSVKTTQEEFIKKARNVHGDKYDYSVTKYERAVDKIKIRCPIHDLIFEQTAGGHLLGYGCPKCMGTDQELSLQDFIAKAREVHGDKYIYTHTNYVGSKSKVTIECPKHGDFMQRASAHLDGQGCPVCSESQGERDISLYLTRNNVRFERQYKIAGCKNEVDLPFDFAIFNQDGTLRCLIEYQGIQHFQEIPFFHKNGKRCTPFKLQQKRDRIKKQYCEKHNIPLLYCLYSQSVQDFCTENKKFLIP